MCLLFLYIDFDGKSDYKLIAINNRDEYYKRPTLDANFWEKSKRTIGGLDLEKGGTWFAVYSDKETVKLGSLLNITGDFHKPGKGRGSIVSDFMSNSKESEIKSYNDSLYDVNTSYSSFNFVSVELSKTNNHSIFYQSNSPRILFNLTEESDKNFFGFGNSPYQKSLKKVNYGLEQFTDIIQKHSTSHKEVLVENLMSLLQDSKKNWPDEELKARAPEWGEYLSSINVNVPNVGYGTRTRTVVLVDNNNKVDYFEETMKTVDPQGEWKSSHLIL